MKMVISFALALMLLSIGCISDNSSTGYIGAAISDSDVAVETNSPVQGVDNLAEFTKVKAGDNVSVHYVGTLEDGTMFDSSIGKSPLTFDVGAGQMIKGFDNGVMGMIVGETKTITIPAAEAYGEINPDYIRDFPISNFEGFPEIKEGMVVSAGNGTQGTIVEVDNNTVKVDFNHQLAGKTLIFNVTLVSINK